MCHFSAFGFLPGACIVMIVELILSGVFFLLCFNDQLGGWFSAATRDGGGGLRSLASGEAGWMSALLVASAVRFGGSPPFVSSIRAPSVWGRGSLPSVGQHDAGVQPPHSAGNRRQQAVASSSQGVQDPLQVLSQMYGISIFRTPGLYLFIFLLAYVVAAVTEETLKYMAPLRFRACRHSACPYVYLVCATACALGFSTVENIGYTFQSAGAPPAAPHSEAASAEVDMATSSGGAGVEDLTARAYTAYSRAVVAVAAHGVFGGLVGLGLTKKHVLGQPLRPWQILLPSVLAHGTFDFQQMLLALEVWDEHLQAVLVVVLDALLLLAAFVYLWRQVARLPLGGQASVPLVGGQDSGQDPLAAADTPDADHVRLLSHQQA